MAKLRLIGRLVGIYLVALGIVSCDLPRLDRGGDIAEPVPSVVVVVVTPAPAQATQEQPAEFAPPPAPQAAQVGNALIRIQPDEQQINVGVTATAEVLLADVVNLVGADVELRFDPALLQVQDADPNTAGVQIQPGDFLAANFVVTNNADNSTGIIRYAVTQVAPTPPVSGSGVLFRVTFQSLAQGASDLSFTTVQLANSDFQEIPATPDNGRINIGQVVATPTPFPSPTSVGPSPTPSPTLPIGVTPIPSITPTPGPGATPTPTVTIPTPTPLPPPPPTPTPPLANLPFEAPPGATVGFCHRVEPGEDILTISTRFGVSPQMINVVNDLYPPGHTFVHQPLFIPTLLGHGPNFYRVEPGDTLTGIAGSCHLKPDILARANGIDENALIGAGQFLFIPIPPFPPPSRYPYPLPIVPVPAPCCPDPYK